MPELRKSRRSGLGQARQVIASIAISGFGTWAYNVGIAVYAYDRTHSAAWVAAVTVGRYVPALVLGWLSGRFIDRLPRRELAVGADAACALAMALVAVLTSVHAAMWLIILVAAISSTLARVQASSVLALAADVVVETELARASVLAGAAEAVATALGSAGASLVLLRYTPPSLFVINAVSFAVSALLVASVKGVRSRPPARSSKTTPAAERPVRGVFWSLQATRAVAALVYGMDIVLLAVIASRQLHSPSAGYGWLLAAAGVGGLVVVVPSRRNAGRALAPIATGGLLIYALPLALFALDPGIGGGIGIQLVRGVGSVLVSSTVISALQRAVPSRMSGRVFSETQALVLAGTTVGAVIAPALLAAVGLRPALLIAAVAPAVLQLALFPSLARFGHREADLLAALEPRITVLRGLDLLREASRSTLYEIADGIEDLSVEAGRMLVRQGDESDAFYVLAAGEVEASDARGGVLRRMRGPDYFGEIGLIRGTPRTATVTAVTPCEIWRVPADVFLSALSEAGSSGALSDTVHLRLQARPRTDQLLIDPIRTSQ